MTLPTPISIVDAVSHPLPEVSWILPDLLAQGQLTVLAGVAGVGKSVLSYTIGMGVATGTQVLGRQPASASCLYFDQENGQADRTRYLAQVYQGLAKPALSLLEARFTCYAFALGHQQWYTLTQELVRRHQPQLLIFDTATSCFDTFDENDNAEAMRTLGRIRHLQQLSTPTATALVLKHARIDADQKHQIRGAKAWEGGADRVLFHLRRRGRPTQDGLHTTYLRAAKTRAIGLREDLILIPTRVAEGQGLRLEVGTP